MEKATSRGIKALIIDMDGVLWRDSKPLLDLPAVFSDISQRGFKVVLATNNATRSIPGYLDKLCDFGIVLKAEQVINSAVATTLYLQEKHPNGGRVYVIGENGFLETLQSYGFYSADDDVIAVLVSMDRGLTFEKLRKATLLIRAGVPFIGTNPDRSFPTPEGLVPGTGAILAALKAATDTEPVIIGKPKPEMYRIALDRLESSPQETLVIGDRLETDIAGAQALGCHTALVLTGVSSKEEAQAWTPPPDFVSKDLATLIKSL
jgi:4-nitrophenyl phosphatase